MRISTVIIAFISFLVGILLGVFGAITLRHEIWPIADRVNILVYSAAVAGVVLLLLFIWYLRIWHYLKERMPHQWYSVLFIVLTFVLVFFLLVLFLGLCIFFIGTN